MFSHWLSAKAPILFHFGYQLDFSSMSSKPLLIKSVSHYWVFWLEAKKTIMKSHLPTFFPALLKFGDLFGQTRGASQGLGQDNYSTLTSHPNPQILLPQSNCQLISFPTLWLSPELRVSLDTGLILLRKSQVNQEGSQSKTLSFLNLPWASFWQDSSIYHKSLIFPFVYILIFLHRAQNLTHRPNNKINKTQLSDEHTHSSSPLCSRTPDRSVSSHCHQLLSD